METIKITYDSYIQSRRYEIELLEEEQGICDEDYYYKEDTIYRVYAEKWQSYLRACLDFGHITYLEFATLSMLMEY